MKMENMKKYVQMMALIICTHFQSVSINVSFLAKTSPNPLRERERDEIN